MRVTYIQSVLSEFKKSLRLYERKIRTSSLVVAVKSYLQQLPLPDTRELSEAELLLLAKILLRFAAEKELNNNSFAKDIRIVRLYQSLTDGFPAGLLESIAPFSHGDNLDSVVFNVFYTDPVQAQTMVAIIKNVNADDLNFLGEAFNVLLTQNIYWDKLLPLLTYLNEIKALTEKNFPIICKSAVYSESILQMLQTGCKKSLNNIDCLRLVNRVTENPALIKSMLKMATLLLERNLYLKYFEKLYQQKEHLRSILGALEFFAKTWYGFYFTEHNLDLILKCPANAVKIANAIDRFKMWRIEIKDSEDLLINTINDWSIFESLISLTSRVWENILNIRLVFINAQYAQTIYDACIVLRENKILDCNAVEAIYSCPALAIQMAAAFVAIHSSSQNLLPEFKQYLIDHSDKIKSTLAAVNSLKEHGLLNEHDVLGPKRLIFLLRQQISPDVLVQSLLLLKKYNLENNTDLLRLLVNNEVIRQLCAVFSDTDLLTKTDFTRLISDKPIEIDFLQRIKDSKQKYILIAALTDIKHPFAYFVLGKIHCGEAWGVDKYYQPKQAMAYFSSIPTHSNFYSEAVFALYNISAGLDEASSSVEVYRRYKLAGVLKELKHPCASRIHESTIHFNNDFAKSWGKSATYLNGLFALPLSDTDMLKKMHDHHLIANHHESTEMQHEFDKRFGLIKL